MSTSTAEQAIIARCRELLVSLVDPYEFTAVLNFFITEAVEAHVQEGLAALPDCRLFGDLSRPEGYSIDPRNLR